MFENVFDTYGTEKLKQWYKDNVVRESMLWHGCYTSQVSFIGALPDLLELDEDLKKHIKIDICGDHRSKSIDLPVYCIDFLMGFKVIMRDNFRDWKVSVISKIPIVGLETLNTEESVIFDANERISSCYCEGFDSKVVFGSYASSNQTFTIELLQDEDLVKVLQHIIKYLELEHYKKLE